MSVIIWLCMVLSPAPVCHTQVFEDGSAIKTCTEVREEVPAICTYLYDEYGDLIFWDCSSQG